MKEAHFDLGAGARLASRYPGFSCEIWLAFAGSGESAETALVAFPTWIKPGKSGNVLESLWEVTSSQSV